MLTVAFYLFIYMNSIHERRIYSYRDFNCDPQIV